MVRHEVVMNVEGTFKVRRFWLKANTPRELMDTLNNVRVGMLQMDRLPYVDIDFYGESDRNITFMELKYGDWVVERQDITYVVRGDDGIV
jgi:hypothetical protein